MTDPQLGGWLMPVIALVYLAAVLWLLCWSVTGLWRCWRAWRQEPLECHEGICDHDQDGRPADVAATLASIDHALDTMGQEGWRL